MNIEDLTYGEMKQIAALFNSGSSAQNNRLAPDGEIRIAVLQRGHIVVGRYSQDGEIGRLDNASVVRRWGTSEGLGELAERGPLPESSSNGPTRLDKCPTVQFHTREVIFLMEVNADAWGKYCN